MWNSEERSIFEPGLFRIVLFIAVAGMLLPLAGCGHKAAPLKPKRRIPRPAAIEGIVGRTNEVLISFRMPTHYLKGAKVKRDLGYKVLRCLVGKCKKVTKGKASPGSLVVVRDSGARTGMVYQYRIDVWGRHDAPPQEETFHSGPPPDPPGELTAKAGEGKVALSWKASTPGLEFRIYRTKQGAEFASPLTLQPTPETSYTDRSVSNNVGYRYQVRSVAKVEGGFLESEPSKTVVVTPMDTTPPAIPGSLSGMLLNGKVYLAWSPNSEGDIAGYKVYRREGRGEKVLLTPTPVTAPVFKDSDIKLRHTYLYYVTAVDKTGNESHAAVFRIRITKEE